MAKQSVLYNDYHFPGAVIFSGTASLPAGTITNAMVNAAAAIAATKVVHQFPVSYKVPDGTTVAATSGDGVPIHIVNASGGATLVAVEVSCTDAPSGGDLTFTVDIQKADAAAAAATVMTSVITYPNATADYTVRPGTITTSAFDDGDTVLVQVAVSGSTGTQGEGLIVTCWFQEASS